MPHIYLTPAAVGYLTQFILALTITGYFTYRALVTRRRDDRPAHLPLLAGFFACVATIVLLFFLDAALPPSPRLSAVYLENTVVGLFLTLLTQFAYRFPRLYPQRKWEARIVLVLNLCYTFWEARFAVHRGRLLLQHDDVLYRPLLPDYVLFACFAWTPLAFLRQTIAASQQEQQDLPGFLNLAGLRHLWRPRGQAARAARAFALVFLIPAALSLVNIWRATYSVSPAVFQSSMSAGILLTQFLFALVYLSAIPEMTTFQLRLVGITLVTVLAVFGAAGWVMTPPHVAVYRPALADRQTLRFAPNAAGGYDVAQTGFRFDADLGNELDLGLWGSGTTPQEAATEIAFTFPFYGQSRRTVWVMRSGAVSVDAPLRYPDMEYHYATAAAIFPLFVALEASPNGGVFAKNEGEHLTITWYQLPATYYPQATFTFQLVLHHDGVFEITTNGLPDLPYQSDASPFVNAWVMGALPGTGGQTPQMVNFAQAPLQGGPQGMVQDHYLAFRRHLHQLLLPLAHLIVLGSLFVVAGFPIAFYFNLIKPLNALLEGVRRVNAGDLDTAMPVQYHDEIGFLTQAFNGMVTQLRELVTGMEARVAERTAELEAQNAELDAFAHTVAHDLKNPLSIVAVGAESLIYYDDLPDQVQRDVLRSIARSAHKGTDIVDNLLLLASARQQAVTPQPLDMGNILGEALGRLDEAIKKQGAEIIAPPAAAWPQAMGYAPWIEEVWVNYISNALKYGGQPPWIELGFSIDSLRSLQVSDLGQELDSAPEGSSSKIQNPKSKIVFWVRDNGRGMTPEECSRLFTPFERLSHVQVLGHGLGLSIVRRIVEKLGGQVGVESEPGQGSVFYFTLPAV
jgi:signal transduction histidine kinase